MADPTTRFRLIPQSTAVIALDTAAERLAAIAGSSVVATGVGSEVDFGTLDISAGAANSGVKTLLWGVTAPGDAVEVSNFKAWMSAIGFDQAGSVAKIRPLSGADQVSPTNTANYVANAVIASYTWVDMPEAEPSQNLWPSDEGSSMVVTTAADDEVMFSVYLTIASGETVGIYKGTDADYSLQMSYKYSFS